MTTHADIVSAIEETAPLALQEDYDNSGFVLGHKQSECRGVLLTFDCTLDAVQEAVKYGCNLIISHHPLIFQPIKKVDLASPQGSIIKNLITHEITHYAAHTSIDNTISGLNSYINTLFHLNNYQTLVPKKNIFKKLVFYVPTKHEDKVKQALFDVGAGTMGHYRHCSFSSFGKGSFQPKEEANPYVGEKNQLHYEEEKRVELLFPVWLEKKLIEALIYSHPYERVAYDVLFVDNSFPEYGSGVIGDLPSSLTLENILEKLSYYFDAKYIRYNCSSNTTIKRVAFCGGSGSHFISHAQAMGADVYITGDLTYHHFADSATAGSMTLVDIGHWESERHVVVQMKQFIQNKFPNFATRISSNILSPLKIYTRV